MNLNQKKGILLHISSLPSPYGIGTLGKEAYSFIDYLSNNGYSYWQMLPLGMTSYGDSPYQCLSAFAGNPYFIDINYLLSDGLLTPDEVDLDWGNDNVNYGLLWENRYKILWQAYLRFSFDEKYYAWVNEQAWLNDYALYMTAKQLNGFKSWQEWPDEYKHKNRIDDEFLKVHGQIYEFWRFLQYKFYEQLSQLKEYAKQKNIKLIGDLPIYVSMDSADVWANPELFLLDKNLNPTEVAGVPPDLFSADGQLWGNPLYDWAYHKATNYEWWHFRLKHILSIFDMIKIDHFRGFESYYKIPFGAKSAKVGHWEKCVELEPFEGISKLIKGRIIAEDLGVITDDVRAMLKRSGFPGMKVLQFGFSTDEKNEYLPKNFASSNYVAYTGTHDNNTTNGWYGDCTKQEKKFFDKYTARESSETPADAMVRLALSSSAKIIIIPMQDILNLGGEARMNYPSRLNWWTFRLNAL